MRALAPAATRLRGLRGCGDCAQPPVLPAGWHFAQVVTEKFDTPECFDVIEALEWHFAHVYAGGADGWQVAQTEAAP